MCGRYASTRSSADLAALFDAYDETEGEVASDYNVAPTDPVPIVRHPVECPRRAGGRGRPGDVAGAHRGPVGPRTGLVARHLWRRSDDQRPGGDGGDVEGVRRAVRPATVPGAGGRLVRVASHRGSQAAVLHDPHRRRDSGVRRYLDDVGPGRRSSAHVQCADVTGRRGLGSGPRPDATGAPAARWEEWLTAPDATGLLTAPPPEYAAGIELRPVGAAVGDVRNDGPDLVRAVPAPPLGRSTVESGDLTLF